jgi:hypothetical protein
MGELSFSGSVEGQHIHVYAEPSLYFGISVRKTLADRGWFSGEKL